MNVNEIDAHKSTLFLCLHNSFLEKLTLEYFSLVVRAVPHGEIDAWKFRHCVFPFYCTNVIFIRKVGCFEDYSPTPSFQVVHPTSVSHEVLLLER
jgi:hypothetical protein